MPQENSNAWKRFFASKWYVAAASAVLFLFVFSYGRAVYQDYQIRQEIRRLQAEAERLEAKKLETLQALEYVKSPAYVEEKARTELNLAKPGEKMAVIQTVLGVKEDGQKNEPMVESVQFSNPAKWWKHFFGGDPIFDDIPS